MSKKVFIGVGHGGTDSGAVKYIVEKEYTLKTAFALSEILSKYGVDFKLSRTQDIDTNMDSKVAMCNNMLLIWWWIFISMQAADRALRYITAVWEVRQRR